MNNILTSVIRTVVPTIVGSITGFLAARGINVDEGTKAQLTAVLSTIFTGVYYVVARYLETKFPKLGWLLGSPKQPVYGEPLELSKGEYEPVVIPPEHVDAIVDTTEPDPTVSAQLMVLPTDLGYHTKDNLFFYRGDNGTVLIRKWSEEAPYIQTAEVNLTRDEWQSVIDSMRIPEEG